MKPRRCPACKRTFVPNHLNSRFCKDIECVKARNRESVRRAQAKNKEHSPHVAR